MGHLGRLGISTHSFHRTFATLYDLVFSPLETYTPTHPFERDPPDDQVER